MTYPYSNGSYDARMYGDDPGTQLGDASLGEMQQTAMRDVEMLPLDMGTTYVVVDTNILLEHLTMLQHFVEDVQHEALSVLLIIPGAVLNELDKQKTRSTGRLGWISRRASLWMADKVKEKPAYLRCQRDRETCKPTGNWRSRNRGEVWDDRTNDGLILDCAMHFARLGGRTCLCTGDRNLGIESESNGVRVVSPSNGNDLARFLFGRDLNHRQEEPKVEYTGMDCLEDEESDEMGMEVDDDRKLSYAQASDLLHLQVIDHFTRLLVALVARIGGPELEDPSGADGGITASRHAPRWKNSRKPSHQWTAVECLDYLDFRQPRRQTNPRLELFLSPPYSTSGARTGREWSFEAWRTALDALKALGESWREPAIVADVDEVSHVLPRRLS
ncbi:PINc domain-containing protein [Mycena chlorophos]|uniref:PINc domain-containing protein n=1 Tax=Mycena chlorophos TaxID=658473 RepID=A0A8H6S564_MYCCL|nr:PINc domain-containing protein [Mycena chlorophos]